jgi:chromate reductase
VRLLGLPGSLRTGSHNERLLRAAAELLPPGATLELWRGLGELPHFNEDDDVEPLPAAVVRLRADLAAADGVLIATPEYNASIPGVLKNALDWASRPFPENALRRRPVAVVGASTSLFGAVWAQAEVRKVLETIGARVVDVELPVGLAHDAFDADGRLVDAAQHAALERAVQALTGAIAHAGPVGAATR